MIQRFTTIDGKTFDDIDEARAWEKSIIERLVDKAIKTMSLKEFFDLLDNVNSDDMFGSDQEIIRSMVKEILTTNHELALRIYNA